VKNKYKFKIGDKVIAKEKYKGIVVRGVVLERSSKRVGKPFNMYYLEDCSLFFLEDELRLETISYMKGRKNG